MPRDGKPGNNEKREDAPRRGQKKKKQDKDEPDREKSPEQRKSDADNGKKKKQKKEKDDATGANTFEAIIGEWRQVENVVTIVKGPSGSLTMFADTTQPPLVVTQLSTGDYEARRLNSQELVYRLQLNSAQDIIEVRKGERSLNIFKIARTKTLIAEWVHPTGKSLPVVVGQPHLEIRDSMKPTLRLLRSKILQWEAQLELESGWEPVYCLEHIEGSNRLIVRRPPHLQDGYCVPLEFARAGSDRKLSQEETAGRASLSSGVHGPSVSFGLVANGPGPCGYDNQAMPPGQQGGPRAASERRSHEDTLDEFCSINDLSDRVVEALQVVSVEEQREVMGLAGGRNNFHLSGTVRDPNAVVMSRLRRLEREPLQSKDLD